MAEEGSGERIVWYGAEDLRPHLRRVGDLTPHPSNKREGDVAAIAESLKRFGQVRPVTIYGDRTMVAGHHVRLAAIQLGWTHIAAIPHEFGSPDEAVLYLYADNQLAQRGRTKDGSKGTIDMMDDIAARADVDGEQIWEGTGFTREMYENRRAARSFEVDEEVPLSRLKPHWMDYAEPSAAQIRAVRALIQAGGGISEVVTVTRDDLILTGRATVEAARELGMTAIRVRKLNIKPDEPLALQILTANRETNRLANVDHRKMTEALRGLDPDQLEATGVDPKALAALLLITRPEDEVADAAAAARLAGDEEFDEEAKRYPLVLSFDSEDEREAFIGEQGIYLSKKTRSVWSAPMPPREKKDLSSLRFFFEDGTIALRAVQEVRDEWLQQVLAKYVPEPVAWEAGAPIYPVYVPSKDRWQEDRALTVKALADVDWPFYVVVEPRQAAEYEARVGTDRLLVMPRDEMTLMGARNWIKDHATAAGAARHWQLDDNIIEFRRLYERERIPCDPGIALRRCEELTDSFANVAISGLNYQMFVTADTRSSYYENVHVYSASLVNNAIPHRWRLVYNDDTDICLQVLADGWCTILMNDYMANKIRTMTVGGGNTDALYRGDGRVRMAHELEKVWGSTGIVKMTRRYGRAQHVVDWGKFTTPLIPVADGAAT